jgi:hypothetical protein
MPDDTKTSQGMAMDGFSKVRPLHEGYLAKGGTNSTSQIKSRPPAPAVLAPKAAPAAPTSVSNKPKA